MLTVIWQVYLLGDGPKRTWKEVTEGVENDLKLEKEDALACSGWISGTGRTMIGCDIDLLEKVL